MLRTFEAPGARERRWRLVVLYLPFHIAFLSWLFLPILYLWCIYLALRRARSLYNNLV
jgi:hypothetical protein